MGQGAAKAIRAEEVAKGQLSGQEKKCVAPQTVSIRKMELVMHDISKGSWAFRAGNSEIVDLDGNVLYRTESYSTNERMFSVKCVGEAGETLCIGVCKDVTGGAAKAVVRLLRPGVSAYKDQADFSKWARENSSAALYPFGTIEIMYDKDTGSAMATYKVTVEDDIGEPKAIPLYTAKVYGDIASMSRYLMAVQSYGDKTLIAKVDQPSGTNSKKLTIEAGEGVDVCAIVMLSLFFGVTKGTIW